MDIRLGLCCINTTLREKDIFCSRRCILKTINDKGIEVLEEKVKKNILDIIKLVHWNERNGIRVLRISSDLIPHASNPKISFNLDFAIPYLHHVRYKIRPLNHRLTMHPGQYNCLGSPNDNVVKNTINELIYHCFILDNLTDNNNKDSVMVIHGGGVYKNKEETIKRFIKNFRKLPENVQNRLVLENCEKSYSIEDCLFINKLINKQLNTKLLPICFDTHHFECYQLLHPDYKPKPIDKLIPKILRTWGNIRPKFHISEQGTGKIGHHSDYIDKIPDYLLEIPDKYNIKIDIMIEAKMKEHAILKLYKKYPKLIKNYKQQKITRTKIKIIKNSN